MKEKEFHYVENLEIINLDRQKAISLSSTCKHTKTESELPISNVKDTKRGKEEKITNFGNEDQDNYDLQTIIAGLGHIDPQDLIIRQDSPYFLKSKRTLVLFKRVNMI